MNEVADSGAIRLSSGVSGEVGRLAYKEADGATRFF